MIFGSFWPYTCFLNSVSLVGLQDVIERRGATTCMESILGRCVFTCRRKNSPFVLLLCMFNFSSLVLHFDSMKIEVQLALHETREQPTLLSVLCIVWEFHFCSSVVFHANIFLCIQCFDRMQIREQSAQMRW